MLVSPTANIIPTIAPDDTSRATELDFTVWLGNAPLNGFVVVVVVADLRLADAALAEGNAVLPDAAAAFEDVPEFASWLTAATPGD